MRELLPLQDVGRTALRDSASPLALPSRRCGLDEVGRGALAGPLVAAGVILPENVISLLGDNARFLRDSKTVPARRRREMAVLIERHALALEIVAISIDVINQRGIGWANREAFAELISRVSAEEYIVDGRIAPHVRADRAARVQCLIKADSLVPEVAAASLVAKVHRDEVMARLHAEFPAYGWNTNSGYGTVAHVAALRAFGLTPQHRTAFVTTALRDRRPMQSALPGLD